MAALLFCDMRLPCSADCLSRYHRCTRVSIVPGSALHFLSTGGAGTGGALATGGQNTLTASVNGWTRAPVCAARMVPQEPTPACCPAAAAFQRPEDLVSPRSH